MSIQKINRQLRIKLRDCAFALCISSITSLFLHNKQDICVRNLNVINERKNVFNCSFSLEKRKIESFDSVLILPQETEIDFYAA